MNPAPNASCDRDGDGTALEAVLTRSGSVSVHLDKARALCASGTTEIRRKVGSNEIEVRISAGAAEAA